MTTEGMPWARVRLVDVDAPDSPLCDCGERAVLEFVAEFDSSGVIVDGPGAGAVVTTPERARAYACVVHGGTRALGVLWAVAGAASSLAAVVGRSDESGQ